MQDTACKFSRQPNALPAQQGGPVTGLDIANEAGAAARPQALFAPDAGFPIVRYEDQMGLPDFPGSAKRANRPMKLLTCAEQKL